ncbi:hypothetical protein Btru_052729 [Bulinus truncatus]|nr:hypothetical protein Btru_052729 [Bulinus truncatus]
MYRLSLRSDLSLSGFELVIIGPSSFVCFSSQETDWGKANREQGRLLSACPSANQYAFMYVCPLMPKRMSVCLSVFVTICGTNLTMTYITKCQTVLLTLVTLTCQVISQEKSRVNIFSSDPIHVEDLGAPPATSTIILYDCTATHRAKADNPGAFQVFHNNEWWTQLCQEGLFWNQTLCRCEYPNGRRPDRECREYRAISSEPTGHYEQFVNGNWIKRDCSLAVAGLVWDQESCQCVWGPRSKEMITGQGVTPCDIMLNMTFEDGLKDSAKGSFVEIGRGPSVPIFTLDPQDAIDGSRAAFFSETALNIWYFASNEMGTSLRVEFRFKMANDPSNRDKYQIFLSNGCNVSNPGYTTPSLAIGYRPADQSYLLAFETVSARKAIVCTKRLGAYNWHTVSLIYEDGTLLLRVDEQPCIISQDFTGPVQKTPCPLTIGADPLERQSMYKGYLDNLLVARYCRRYIDSDPAEFEKKGPMPVESAPNVIVAGPEDQGYPDTKPQQGYGKSPNDLRRGVSDSKYIQVVGEKLSESSLRNINPLSASVSDASENSMAPDGVKRLLSNSYNSLIQPSKSENYPPKGVNRSQKLDSSQNVQPYTQTVFSQKQYPSHDVQPFKDTRYGRLGAPEQMTETNEKEGRAKQITKDKEYNYVTEGTRSDLLSLSGNKFALETGGKGKFDDEFQNERLFDFSKQGVDGRVELGVSDDNSQEVLQVSDRNEASDQRKYSKENTKSKFDDNSYRHKPEVDGAAPDSIFTSSPKNGQNARILHKTVDVSKNRMGSSGPKVMDATSRVNKNDDRDGKRVHATPSQATGGGGSQLAEAEVEGHVFHKILDVSEDMNVGSDDPVYHKAVNVNQDEIGLSLHAADSHTAKTGRTEDGAVPHKTVPQVNDMRTSAHLGDSREDGHANSGQGMPSFSTVLRFREDDRQTNPKVNNQNSYQTESISERINHKIITERPLERSSGIITDSGYGTRFEEDNDNRLQQSSLGSDNETPDSYAHKELTVPGKGSVDLEVIKSKKTDNAPLDKGSNGGRKQDNSTPFKGDNLRQKQDNPPQVKGGNLSRKQDNPPQDKGDNPARKQDNSGLAVSQPDTVPTHKILNQNGNLGISEDTNGDKTEQSVIRLDDPVKTLSEIRDDSSETDTSYPEEDNVFTDKLPSIPASNIKTQQLPTHQQNSDLNGHYVSQSRVDGQRSDNRQAEVFQSDKDKSQDMYFRRKESNGNSQNYKKPSGIRDDLYRNKGSANQQTQERTQMSGRKSLGIENETKATNVQSKQSGNSRTKQFVPDVTDEKDLDQGNDNRKSSTSDAENEMYDPTIYHKISPDSKLKQTTNALNLKRKNLARPSGLLVRGMPRGGKKKVAWFDKGTSRSTADDMKGNELVEGTMEDDGETDNREINVFDRQVINRKLPRLDNEENDQSEGEIVDDHVDKNKQVVRPGHVISKVKQANFDQSGQRQLPVAKNQVVLISPKTHQSYRNRITDRSDQKDESKVTNSGGQTDIVTAAGKGGTLADTVDTSPVRPTTQGDDASSKYSTSYDGKKAIPSSIVADSPNDNHKDEATKAKSNKGSDVVSNTKGRYSQDLKPREELPHMRYNVNGMRYPKPQRQEGEKSAPPSDVGGAGYDDGEEGDESDSRGRSRQNNRASDNSDTIDYDYYGDAQSKPIKLHGTSKQTDSGSKEIEKEAFSRSQDQRLRSEPYHTTEIIKENPNSQQSFGTDPHKQNLRPEGPKLKHKAGTDMKSGVSVDPISTASTDSNMKSGDRVSHSEVDSAEDFPDDASSWLEAEARHLSPGHGKPSHDEGTGPVEYPVRHMPIDVSITLQEGADD